MRAPTLAIAFCAAGSHAFVGAPVQQMGCAATTRPHSCAQPLSMVATPLKSRRPGKLKVIEEVTELLGKTTFIFSVPSSNIKANDVVKLRKELPEGCTARVVKNKLMRIACKGTEFEELSEVTTGENFWMFVEGEDNLSEPIKIITAFAKNADKHNVAWQAPFKAGVFAGELLDGRGVVAISKLPTKQELIQRLAIALKSVPTKLGRSINLVPTKVGRVVKLAFAEEGAGGEEGAAPAVEEEAAAAVPEVPVAEAVVEAEAAEAPPAEDAPAAE